MRATTTRVNRRALLAVVGTATAGAAAARGYRLTGPVEFRSFAVSDDDEDCDWASRTPRPGGDPVIERHADDRRVVVYGFVYVGSESCDRAAWEPEPTETPPG